MLLQVLSYLQLFADMHKLHKHIQYNTQVLAATPLSTAQHLNGNDSSGDSCSSNLSWQLSSVQIGDDGQPADQPHEQVRMFFHSRRHLSPDPLFQKAALDSKPTKYAVCWRCVSSVAAAHYGRMHCLRHDAINNWALCSATPAMVLLQCLMYLTVLQGHLHQWCELDM
jgi:hypothetical protein